MIILLILCFCLEEHSSSGTPVLSQNNQNTVNAITFSLPPVSTLTKGTNDNPTTNQYSTNGFHYSQYNSEQWLQYSSPGFGGKVNSSVWYT